MKNDQSLDQLRHSIDHLDDQILTLISDRAKLAQDVAQAKQGVGIYQPGREAQILERVAAANPSPLSGDAVQGIFREIIAACRNLEQPLSVAYLGPAGSYSEAAARRHFGHAAHLVPQSDLAGVVAEAEKGSTQLAVVPIENSIEGTVNATLDLLRQTPLLINGEILLPIHHQLLTHAASLEDVTEVIAHPQALAQCAQWLSRHLPQATRTEAASNSQGARQAAAGRTLAAIAGLPAAELYQLPVLATNIEDQSSNTTRFLVLGSIKPTHTGHDKTSLLCITPNRPGALNQLLSGLAARNVNLTALEARPSRENNWDYVFHIDVQGHRDESPVREALADLQTTATFVKILGSYPAGKVN